MYYLDFRANAQKPKGQGCANWPLVSEAAAVHPSQVQEAMEHDRQHGVSTQYTRDGCPIFTSAKHRRDWCYANGMHDRNAGFGDPTPRGRAHYGLPELPKPRFSHLRRARG